MYDSVQRRLYVSACMYANLYASVQRRLYVSLMRIHQYRYTPILPRTTGIQRRLYVSLMRKHQYRYTPILPRTTSIYLYNAYAL